MMYNALHLTALNSHTRCLNKYQHCIIERHTLYAFLCNIIYCIIYCIMDILYIYQHCSIERHTTYAFLCNIHVEPYLPLDCCEQCPQLEYANMPCNSQCRQFNEDHSIHSASSQSNLLLLFCALRAM